MVPSPCAIGSDEVNISDIEFHLHESRPTSPVNHVHYLMACPLTSAPIELARSEGFTHAIRILCKDLSLFSGEDKLAAEAFFRAMREREVTTPCTLLVTDGVHPPEFLSKDIPWRISARAKDCVSARVADCPSSARVGTLFTVRLQVKNESPTRKRVDVICGSYGESNAQLLGEFKIPR